MAIQVRRGNEADFDANKMLPGEWAVSLDTKYVRMCFAPGVVLRMATYEGFENEKAQIQSILSECQSIQSAVERIQAEVNTKASLTIEYSNSASLSATRASEEATRASEEAERAHEEAERAKTYANNAEAVTGVQIATMERAGLVKGGDNYIAEDGTLTLITETTETTMQNSCEGRLLFKEIRGKSEQKQYGGHNQFNLDLKIAKNGIDFDISGSEIKVSGTPSSDYGSITNFNEIPFNMNVGKSYKIISNTTNLRINIWLYDEANNIVATFISNGASVTVPNSITRGTLYYDNAVVGKAIDETISVMLTTSDYVGDYEPYVGGQPSPSPSYPQEIKSVAISGIKTHDGNGNKNNITFSQPIELNNIGDVKDAVEGGKTTRRFAKKVFDGSETWSSSGGFLFSPNAISVSEAINSNTTYNALCDMAEIVSRSNMLSQINQACFSSYGNFSIYNSYGEDVAGWKAHLSQNPMTVVYELETPVTEELPTADQVALNSLSTYDGITYLEFDSEIKPTFEGEYGTSKVGGYTLEGMLAGRNGELMGKDYANRISALEASVVNNI